MSDLFIHMMPLAYRLIFIWPIRSSAFSEGLLTLKKIPVLFVCVWSIFTPSD